MFAIKEKKKAKTRALLFSFNNIRKGYGMSDDLREELEKNYASSLETEKSDSTIQQLADVGENNNTPDVATPAEIIAAPISYKQEFKDSFNTLTPDWQKYLIQREKEYSQGISKARNEYNWIDDIYRQRKANLEAQGITSNRDYINTLVSISDMLEKNPQLALTKLAEAYGVVSDNSLEAKDRALQEKLYNQEQQISQITNYLDELRASKAKDEVFNFTNAKDDAGNLKYPYFEDVREQMRNIISSGLTVNLEEAYNQAVWTNADIRAKLIAAQRQKEIDKQINEAQKAKDVSFSPTSKSTPEVTENKSTRDFMKAEYKRLIEGE